MAALYGRSARKALQLAEHPESFLSAVQLWITPLSLLTGCLRRRVDGRAHRRAAGADRLAAPYAGRVGFVAGFLIMLFLFGLVGELVPKRIGTLRPEQIARRVAYPMDFFARAGQTLRGRAVVVHAHGHARARPRPGRRRARHREKSACW